MTQFQFKKKYGQNFLQNSTICEKIVSSINPQPADLIIEIGPGSGALTKRLKTYGCQLIAFEIDRELEKFLHPLEDDKTKIIFEDFLNADIKKIVADYDYNDLFIIGNLPYYITTPILEKIITSKIEPLEIVIMVQKEVADRFLARPKTKEYGYMTVLLNYHFNIEKIADVSRTFFNPSPNVDSTVIKLIKKESQYIDYDKFVTFLKSSFQFKRKTISNNLKNYDQSKLHDILITHGYELSSRAEEIDLDTFIELSQNL